MNVQIIEKNGNPEWAVIPYKEYLRLVAEAEMIQDVRDYDSALKTVEAGGEEVIPAEVVYAVLDGENPIRVWREYRKLTQRELAQVAEISIPYLSQLETGHRSGSTEVLSSIAEALDVSLEDILKVKMDE